MHSLTVTPVLQEFMYHSHGTEPVPGLKVVPSDLPHDSDAGSSTEGAEAVWPLRRGYSSIAPEQPDEEHGSLSLPPQPHLSPQSHPDSALCTSWCNSQSSHNSVPHHLDSLPAPTSLKTQSSLCAYVDVRRHPLLRVPTDWL